MASQEAARAPPVRRIVVQGNRTPLREAALGLRGGKKRAGGCLGALPIYAALLLCDHRFTSDGVGDDGDDLITRHRAVPDQSSSDRLNADAVFHN